MHIQVRQETKHLLLLALSPPFGKKLIKVVLLCSPRRLVVCVCCPCIGVSSAASAGKAVLDSIIRGPLARVLENLNRGGMINLACCGSVLHKLTDLVCLTDSFESFVTVFCTSWVPAEGTACECENVAKL